MDEGLDAEQGRIGLVLAAIAIVAGALLWWWGDEASRPSEGEARLWSLDVADVVEVRWAARDGACIVRREGAGDRATWSLIHAERTMPLDPSARLELLDALDEASDGRPAPGLEPSVTGLDAPIALAVRTADGRTLEVEVGQAAPVGRRTWVRRDDGEVLAVQGALAEALDGDCIARADRALVRRDGLLGLEVLLEDGSRFAVERGDDAWVSVEGAPVDRATDWVLRWRELRVARWRTVGDAEPDGPVHTVILRREDGDRTLRVRLESGGAVVDFPDGRSGYVPSLDGALLRGVVGG